GLGVIQPASPGILDEILGIYRDAGITMFLLQSLPHCRPAAYEDWLRQRGLRPFDAQDRIVRGAQPLALETAARGDRKISVEWVTDENADEWADFLQRDYRLETGRWLQALVGREGWSQYVARERGEIVAARGMYIGTDRIAWIGIDAPVPGLRTADYE